MLANFITMFRVVLLFGVMCLLYWEGPWPKVLAFVGILIVIWMDALDGQIARKYHQRSDLGSVLDITGDRIVENVLWICFAHKGLVSVWVPIIVLTRGFITDSIRSVALGQGMTAFGDKTMMTSKVGKFLVSSRFSRALYGALKTVAFAYIIFLVALESYRGLSHEAFMAWGTGNVLWMIKDVLVALTVLLCVVRGIPVIVDGRRFFKLPGQKAEAGEGGK